MRKCDECKVYKILTLKGFYCCPVCGRCDFDYMLPGEYKNDTTVYSVPSVHSRFKWRKCDECDVYKIVTIKGFYCCPVCGLSDFDYMLPGEYKNDTTVYSVPSVHSRFKWMTGKLDKKRILKDDNQIDVIAHDFCDVVNEMEKNGFIKGRNVSRYDYYIIRLASRRGLTFDITKLKDLKPSKIRRDRDDKLFGVVYPALGWEPSECQYYKNWLGLRKSDA